MPELPLEPADIIMLASLFATFALTARLTDAVSCWFKRRETRHLPATPDPATRVG